MRIRDCTPLDLPALVELTIETFRPLLAGSLRQLRPEVTAHDHGRWEDDYRHEVPSLLAPDEGRFITLAEEHGSPWGTSAGTPPARPPAGWRWLLSTPTLAAVEWRERSARLH